MFDTQPNTTAITTTREINGAINSSKATYGFRRVKVFLLLAALIIGGMATFRTADANDQLPTQVDSFLVQAETTAKATCSDVPEDFWIWLDSHPEIKKGLLSAHDPIRPHVVRNLHFLTNSFPEQRVERYTDLLLAVAVARSHEDVRYEEETLNAPSEAVLRLETEIQAMTEFARTSTKSLAELVADGPSVFEEANVRVSSRDYEAIWYEVAHRLGVFPRQVMPTLPDFLNYLIDHHELELPLFNDGEPEWPIFPLARAPWPLLMPLSDVRPLDECQYVWNHYLGLEQYEPSHKTGEISRVKTYGKYGWDYKQTEVRYKESSWHPKAMPRVIEDGGVCGRLSSLARTTWLALGVPASHMGQPKHSAYMRYEITPDGHALLHRGHSVSGLFNSKSQWRFRDSDGLRFTRTDDVVGFDKVGMEYSVGLSLAMNHGLDAYLDTRIAMHVARQMDRPDQAEERRALLLEAIDRNPYNVEVWYALAQQAGSDLPEARRLVSAVRETIGAESEVVSYSEERPATTDFNDVSQEDREEIESLTGQLESVRAMAIIEHNFALAIEEKECLDLGLNFLKEEQQRGAAQEKDIYSSQINELMGRFDVAVNGIEGRKQEVTEFILAELQRTRTSGKFKSSIFRGHVDPVLEGFTNVDEKIEWLEQLQTAFEEIYPEEQLFWWKKDRYVAVNDNYNYLIRLHVQALESKGGDWVQEARRVQSELEAKKKLHEPSQVD